MPDAWLRAGGVRAIEGGGGLTQAEQLVLRQVALGEEADLSGAQPHIDASTGAQWDHDRELRAEFLHALCTGYTHTFPSRLHGQTDAACAAQSWPVHPRGVRVRGAKVVGRLDLSFAELTRPLLLHSCFFDSDEPLNLEQTCMPALSLSGSHLRGLYGDGLQTRGDIRLDTGFTAHGRVRLRNAAIGGDLLCSAGTFTDPDGYALYADRATVSGGVFLNDGFKAEGAVRLLDATLGGLTCNGGTFTNPDGHAINASGATVTGAVLLNDGFKAEGAVRLLGATLRGLDCSAGTFTNPNGDALNADRATVTGAVLLNNGFKAQGAVCLFDATLGGLYCSGGTFTNPNGYAIDASGATVTGPVLLNNGFTAEGEVRLIYTTLGGLYCDGGTFANPDGDALNADRLTVTGNVFLNDGFTAQGQVRLLDATLGGLYCDGGTFANPDGDALNADGLTVTGNVVLNDGFTAQGAVRLLGATLGGLDCSAGTFTNPNGDALNASGATVAGAVLLTDGFKAHGEVRLLDATIGGWLSCSGGLFLGQRYALDGERMSVTGAFVWTTANTSVGIVGLADARIGELRDTPDAWPAQADAVILDGLTYDSLEPAGTVEQRIGWVTRYCSGGRYTPQPYEQLSAYLRRVGREPDARTVNIAKEQARRASLGVWRRPGHWLFGLTVGYGWRLWRALAPLVVLVAVGAVLFAHAHRGCEGPDAYQAPGCAMTPDDMSPPPAFQPVVYALDTVLPIIDLRQQDLWTPEGGYRWWFWTSITGGWMLTTAVVAGLTRAISKT